MVVCVGAVAGLVAGAVAGLVAGAVAGVLVPVCLEPLVNGEAAALTAALAGPGCAGLPAVAGCGLGGS